MQSVEENKHSIHLSNFIKFTNSSIDNELIEKMNLIREVCSSISFIRKENNIRVRIPLKTVTVYAKNSLLSIFDANALEIIKDEVNAKEILIASDDFGKFADIEVALNFKTCGKKLGGSLKKVMENKSNFQKIENDKIKILDFILEKEDYDFIYTPKDKNSKLKSCNNGNILIAVDSHIDREIFISTLARDLIRAIQVERKNKSLNIEEKIDIEISVNIENIEEIIFKYLNEIKKETLSDNILFKVNDNNLISLRKAEENINYADIINNFEIYVTVLNDKK